MSEQVPDHRFEELQRQLREVREQNNALRGQIEQMANPQKQAKDPVFKPEVEEAIADVVQRRVAQGLVEEINRLKNTVGFVVDGMDQVTFNQKYANDRYKPFHKKVEEVRQQAQARGQYLTREQALQMVYFEETGKKPQEAPATQNKEPKFDPYLGMYVDENGRPINPAQSPAPTEDEGQQQMTPQGHQAPQGQAPMGQQGQQQAPQQVPPGAQQFNLPGVSPVGQQAPAPTSGHLELSLDASDEALSQFESRYGDIPL